jgi:hypothetical protein
MRTGEAVRGVAGGHNESYPNRRPKSRTGPREARRFSLTPDNFELCHRPEALGPDQHIHLIHPL